MFQPLYVYYNQFQFSRRVWVNDFEAETKPILIYSQTIDYIKAKCIVQCADNL